MCACVNVGIKREVLYVCNSKQYCFIITSKLLSSGENINMLIPMSRIQGISYFLILLARGQRPVGIN